ncbi:MAG: hypothetical protein ACKO4T_04355, partial [Planctomycetaceae bacterium]
DGVIDVLDAAGMLGAARFDTWLPSTWSQGDFNHDAVVDILDAADFISAALFDTGGYLPQSTGPGAPVAAVPEPTWGGLLALIAAGGLATRLRGTPSVRSPRRWSVTS